MRKIIAVLLAICGLLSVAPAFATTGGSSGVTASVNVQVVCSLNIDNNAINFNTPLPGTNDNPADLTVKATTASEQNTQIDVTIGGTPWSGPSSMVVGQTKYSLNGIAPWTPLTSSAPLFSSSTSHFETATFVLDIPNNQPAGIYSQTITLTFDCPQPTV